MSAEITRLASYIAAAYVSNNSVRPDDLPDLLQKVYGSLEIIINGAPEQPIEAKPVPPVSIKKTIHHDYLISLEDGGRYKTLCRHLSKRGMTPDDYRAKWGLPSDYPMVARAYSEARSGLARSLGLGRKATAEVEAVKVDEKANEPQVGAADEIAPARAAPARAKRSEKVTPILKPKDRAARPKKHKSEAETPVDAVEAA